MKYSKGMGMGAITINGVDLGLEDQPKNVDSNAGILAMADFTVPHGSETFGQYEVGMSYQCTVVTDKGTNLEKEADDTSGSGKTITLTQFVPNTYDENQLPVVYNQLIMDSSSIVSATKNPAPWSMTTEDGQTVSYTTYNVGIKIGGAVTERDYSGTGGPATNAINTVAKKG